MTGGAAAGGVATSGAAGATAGGAAAGSNVRAAGAYADAGVGSGPLINCPVRMKPTASVNMPSDAISTVGIFFGHDGVLETIPREMIRASGDEAPTLSRAVASRYLAR